MMLLGNVMPRALTRGRQNRQIDTKRADPFRQRTRRRRLALDSVKEAARLSDEKRIAIQRSELKVLPWLVGPRRKTPPARVVLEAGGAAFAHDGDRELVGRLVLVVAVAAEHMAVTGHHVYCVFDVDSVEHEARGVRRHAVDGADEPFRGV